MKIIRILQTPIRFYPYIGGVEKYTFGLSRALVRMGHRVKVICADEPRSDVKKIEGINITRLPYIGKIANTNITLGLIFSLLKEDFDITHSYFPTPWSLDFSVIMGKLKKKKVIVTYCNDIIGDSLFSSLIMKIYNNTLLRFNLLLADGIIIIQPNYIKYSKYLKIFKKKIKYIPPGVDINKFKKIKLSENESSVFFLSVLDKYHKYKGLDYLLRAISKVKTTIPNVKLIIGGKGEMIKKYKKLSLKLGINNNVNFIGFVSDKKLQYLYSQSKVFILPSVGHEEGFGIVLLEAMACKTPVIATDIVGVATEVKQYNCGIIIKPRNSEALAEAILKILNNPKLATKMGENGRKLVEEKYDWDKVAKINEKFYQEVLG